MREADEIVAGLLEELADLEELRGTDYKPRAYRRAAHNLRRHEEPVERLHAEGRLGDVEGVGEAIEGKIAQALAEGTFDALERAREDVPVDVRTLGRVRGLGPRKLAKLHEELGVTTLDELEAAAREGAVEEVPGFGAKTQAKILDQVDRVRRTRSRWVAAGLAGPAGDLADELAARPAVEDAAVVGGLRRRLPLVEGLTFLATAGDPEAAREALLGLDGVESVEAEGARRAAVELTHGPPAELVLVEPRARGAALVTHTGSREHVERLRARAADRELALTGTGLEGAEGQTLETPDEAAVYEALELSRVPPELREATGEVEAAGGDRLPDLIEPGDVRGDLQMHTVYSDGATGVEALARKADELGYEYILVTDHGPSLSVAGAPDLDELAEQGEDVDRVNADEAIGATVLHGVEANVLEDGIDVPANVCRELDLVVASLHDRVDDATERLVHALEAYPVDVLGHPTNRRLNEREGNDLDVDRIAEVARANDVAIEINAQPDRLDLPWREVRRLKGEVEFVVSTDAHSPEGMEHMVHGVRQARKGWLEPDDVANAQPLDELLDRLGRG